MDDNQSLWGASITLFVTALLYIIREQSPEQRRKKLQAKAGITVALQTDGQAALVQSIQTTATITSMYQTVLTRLKALEEKSVLQDEIMKQLENENTRLKARVQELETSEAEKARVIDTQRDVINTLTAQISRVESEYEQLQEKLEQSNDGDTTGTGDGE